MSLKHTRNPYSVFKDSDVVRIGPDCIMHRWGAVPYSDKALAEIKKVYKGKIDEMQPTLEKLLPTYKENDVIIQGNPKVDEGGKNSDKAYAFIVGDEVYAVQQKFIDAYSGNGNIIKANKNPLLPWSVFNKEGELVAVFLPMKADANGDYINLPTVNDVLSARKSAKEQKKAELVKKHPDVKFSIENELQNNSFGDIISKEDIPYREKRQLEEYILSKNHSSNKLKNFDCKEIGDNFYVWHNNSRTDFDVVGMIEIEGNENLIDDWRDRIYGKDDRSTSTVHRLVQKHRYGRGSNNLYSSNGERAGGYGVDDRLYSGQSTSDRRGNISKSGRNTQRIKTEKGTENEQSGNNSLLGNSRRTNNESAGEQDRQLQSSERENQGKTEAERKAAAKKLFAEQKTGREIITTQKGKIRINTINPDSYDADMQSIVDEYKNDGIETVLFVGRGEKAFDGNKKLKIDGFAIGNKIYLRYDGKTAPQNLKNTR